MARYLLGVVAGAVSLIPLCMASRAWCTRLLAQWRGAPLRLAEIVVDIAAVTCISEFLGIVGLFRLLPVVIALASVGIVGLIAARRTEPQRTEAIPQPTVGGLSLGWSPPGLIAVVATSIVVADWSAWTISALDHGVAGVDTFWYHMPFAARFVQDGSITHLHYTDGLPVTVFFPAGSEMLHALGIIFMGNDVLSPLLNMAWLAVALLAAWCVGRPFGIAPLTLTGLAFLLASPGLVATQPGSAYDDIAGLALLLSSIALLVNAEEVRGSGSRVPMAIAALAAGLALGTKFTFIAPVGALTIVIFLRAQRGDRLRQGGLWLLLVTVTGGFWYIRNLVAVGNPLPSLRIKLGPVALPSPPIRTPTSTVAHFILNAKAWRMFLLPGLRLSYGPVWWWLLGLSVAGLILGVVVGRTPLVRLLAAVGVVTAIAFLVTPQFLVEVGAPVFFVDNVRYVDPALALGVVFLPLAPVFSSVRWMKALVAAYVGGLVATQLDPTLWPIGLPFGEFAAPVHGVESLLGLFVGVVVLVLGTVFVLKRGAFDSVRLRIRLQPFISIVAIAVVIVAGFALQQN